MSDAGRAQQAGQAAKEQASATASRAAQSAGDVAGTAAEQARAVAGEARQQAGNAARDLRQRVLDEGQGQAQRLAGTVRQWADDFAGMAQNAPGESPARTLVTQAADGGHRAADYLDKNGVDGLLGDLQKFARRRPGAFLGGAVLAGLAVGRLAKAGKAVRSGDSGRPATSGGDDALPPAGQAPPELPGYPGV